MPTCRCAIGECTCADSSYKYDLSYFVFAKRADIYIYIYIYIVRRTIEMSMECLCIYRSFECVDGVADGIQSIK